MACNQSNCFFSKNCCAKLPKMSTVEGGELGRWCELGQNFSDLSSLLVKGHWCAMGRKCSAL